MDLSIQDAVKLFQCSVNKDILELKKDYLISKSGLRSHFFMENNWPYSTSAGSFFNILCYALPFMALVSFLILYFFWFKAGI